MNKDFNMYEAIARSHNNEYPQGPSVTEEDVRKELPRLLSIYGRFKRVQSADQEERGVGYCSFCGRSNAQVRVLIAGPGGVFICNDCVKLCQSIIDE
jgi:hypothetical protein